MKIEKPGQYEIPAEAYHADPCPEPSLSASVADLLLRKTPRHAWCASPRLNPAFQPRDEDRFRVPTALHSMTLEDAEPFEIVDEKDWRKAAAKESKEDAYAAGKTPLLRHEYDALRRQANTVRLQIQKHPDAGPAFKQGKAEQTLVWQEGDSWCRCRPDWLTPDNVIWDLKSTAVLPSRWDRHAFDMAYDLRVGFYRRAMRALFGVEDPAYFFLNVESSEPWALYVTAFTPEALHLADLKAAEAVRRWQWCMANDWPGFDQRVHWIGVPGWEAVSWEEDIARRDDAKQQGKDLLQIALEWQAPLEKEAS